MQYALKVLQEELEDAEDVINRLTLASEEYSLSVRDQDAYDYAYYQFNSLLEAIDVLKENS